MNVTYHLASVEELTTDILEAIKANFKSKPIVITVEEEIDATTYLMSSPANKNVLKKSIEQDKNGEHIVLKL
jgi:spore coat protein CotF